MPYIQDMRYALAVPLVLALAACQTTTDPGSLPLGAEWLDPIPAEYASLWRETEQCSGLSGDFAAVRWIVYPNNIWIPNTTAVGRTTLQTSVIELVNGAVHSSEVVTHEMLHLLLGTPGHPGEYFLEKCGQLVAAP